MSSNNSLLEKYEGKAIKINCSEVKSCPYLSGLTMSLREVYFAVEGIMPSLAEPTNLQFIKMRCTMEKGYNFCGKYNENNN